MTTPKAESEAVRRDVEMLAQRVDMSLIEWDGVSNRILALAAENAALLARAEAAEARSYALAVAIMGGEDAPGYADSIPTQDLVDQQRKMATEWADDLVRLGKRHRETQAELITAQASINTAWCDGFDAGGMYELMGMPDDAQTAPPPDAAAALQRAKDAEWNRALEAAYDACLTCEGALNNAGAAAMKVRALRKEG